MECTYVHFQSELMNMSVRQNIHLFMTVTSNHCINNNKIGALIDNIEDGHIFVLDNNDRETKLNLVHALKTFLGGLRTV